MSRIAILADIHGNLPALEAVIADLAAQGVDEVLVGGDIVGRGPEGSKAVRRVAALGWPSVRGNHEDYLVALRRDGEPADWLGRERWAAARWMAAELEPPQVRELAVLPKALVSARAPGLRLVHGSTRSNSEGLGPWSSDAELAWHLCASGAEVLACAHTHRPMVREIVGGLVVNVGAVGLPFNRDRRAQYAVVESRGGRWSVEPRQVVYDLGATLAIYEASGFLRHGGVTARLLKMELEEAAPFLVPFLRWAAVLEIAPESSRIPEFLRAYDPDRPLREFYARLAG